MYINEILWKASWMGIANSPFVNFSIMEIVILQKYSIL